MEIRKQEQISTSEIENKLRELESKKKQVRKVNLFSDDENDEFKVTLKNGEVVGIFKTWAVPVIPFLEDGVNIDNPKWETVKKWEDKISTNPVLAWETMERFRATTESYDRRLLKVFSERQLPKSKVERVSELFWRLKTAFAFAAPFYHIEAMVGDGNSTPGNPFSETDEFGGSGGFLDMAGMLLPSALGEMVRAEKLDWKNLDWKGVEDMVVSNTDLDKMAILMRVARAAGIKAEEVLFAANALEWIPVSVGGKKDDLEETEAEAQLLKFSTGHSKLTLGTVARDMNGLVRFMNWTPLVKDGVNFSEAAWWKYAAACETSNQIIEELSDGSLISSEQRDEFVNLVLPQLKNLDASSARGRFALWMFDNGWFGNELGKSIRNSEVKVAKEMMLRLVEIEAEESIVELGESNNRFLVGGKAAGLYEAQTIFGKELVGDGLVITSEAISRWLESDVSVKRMTKELDNEQNMGKKVRIGERIQQRIQTMTFPESLSRNILKRTGGVTLAVRSSSFDEDTLVNGSAAGIYESEVGVTDKKLPESIAKVVSSFFSEKAVSYRKLHGLSDIPAFAVLIQEFLPGTGGVVFSKGDGDGWTVSTGETPGHVVGADLSFDRVDRSQGLVRSDIKSGWVNDKDIEMVGNLAVLAETVLGGKTDMEFVVTKNGLQVLQLRMLNDAQEKGAEIKEVPKKWFSVVSLENLSGVIFKEASVGLNVDKKVDIEQFQGELFRCLVKNRDKISTISLARRIPRTSHFANICLNLGIKLVFRDE